MIACECGGCGSTYKVKDQNAGKRFQCKHCDEMVRVPGGGGAPKRRKKPEYDDYAEDDYDDGDDDYGADDYDDGYDDYGDDGYDDYEERRPAPRRRSPKKSSLTRYVGNPLLWIGIPIGIGLFVGLLSMIAVGAGVVAGFGAVAVCGIISVCFGLHSLVLAFKEDAVCGIMYLFVPFYSLYYLITRWDEQREPFVTQLSMTLAMILAMVGMMAAGD